MPPIPLSDPVPSATAGPEEIRQYVVNVLTTRHDVPIPEAQAISSKWQFLRGDAFRKMADWAFGDCYIHAVFGEPLTSSLADSMRYDGGILRRGLRSSVHAYSSTTCVRREGYTDRHTGILNPALSSS